MAKTTLERRWTGVRIGLDWATASRQNGVVMAFGAGPADDDGPEPTRRLVALIDDPAGPSAIRHCRQIHGRILHTIDDPTAGVIGVGDGDGLITVRPGVGLLVWTADCVPVLVAGDGVVAAIHAGWRGCAEDIVGTAIDRLIRERHQAAERLRVVLGPAICGACYRVGPEVRDALARVHRDEVSWRAGDRVDLRAFLRARLEGLGVPGDRIAIVGGCTYETPELASYRRDGGAAGRQWSMVCLDAGC